MRVEVHPVDEGGCGWYRLWWPAQALQAQGHDVAIQPPRATRIVHDMPPDVIVLQRPARPQIVEAIGHLQQSGIAVVVDIDDDMTAISRRNVSWAYGVKINRWWMDACSMADLVTVTTPALARRYAPHGRVAVVPNCVPERYLEVEPEEPHDGVYVGWSGGVNTHPDDLQQTRGGVARALASTGARCAVVGTGKDVRANLGLDHDPLACGWVAIEEYPHRVAELDVGIVPLEPSAFNEAKSWLKGLEMAALGVPFVASPTEQYSRLAKLGAGVMAERSRQWEAIVRRLVQSEAGRAEMAARGRSVAAQWTIEGNAWRWAEAWAAALTGDRAA